MVVQVYEERPLLIENRKFDLRLYVLVTSIDPLRIYIYKDGIVWFATLSFELENITGPEWQFIHLTNFSINKNNG